MGTRHKHADVIIAWANGEAIEYKNLPDGRWYEIKYPHWDDETEYRIKPKIVKREGWVNVYGEGIVGKIIHHSKESAISWASCPIKATVRIEWEEEV